MTKETIELFGSPKTREGKTSETDANKSPFET